MKSTLLAAGLIAAMAAGAPGVRAADLEYGPRDRYGSAYDDPRYRDLYGPPRQVERYTYQPTYRPPTPPPFAYDDDEDERFEPRRFAEEYRYEAGCLPRHEVRRRLRDEGWSDFHDLEIRRSVAVVRARRPDGLLFDLKVDRCTGQVVHARPLDRFVPGPFAYGPRRWTRPYY